MKKLILTILLAAFVLSPLVGEAQAYAPSAKSAPSAASKVKKLRKRHQHRRHVRRQHHRRHRKANRAAQQPKAAPTVTQPRR